MIGPNPAELPVLTIEEAAALLRISRSAAYAAASRGDLPILRIGRVLRVPTARLMAMMDCPSDLVREADAAGSSDPAVPLDYDPAET